MRLHRLTSREPALPGTGPERYRRCFRTPRVVVLYDLDVEPELGRIAAPSPAASTMESADASICTRLVLDWSSRRRRQIAFGCSSGVGFLCSRSVRIGGALRRLPSGRHRAPALIGDA